MSQNPTDEVWIDGDILPYQIGFATQRTVYIVEVEGEHSAPLLVTRKKVEVNKYLKLNPDLLVSEVFLVEEAAQALATLKLHITNIVIGSGCERFKVVLSGKDNFRNRVANIQAYKENRKGFQKPEHFDMLRQWLSERPYTIFSEDEEADDVISKAMVQGKLGATIDKDLNNTPGWHYNFNNNEVYYVDEDTANRNFYKQMLTGDRTDNIPGVRGIGPKGADKLIDPCRTVKEMEEAVFEAYSKVYPNPYGAMVEIGQLLWMRREDNEWWHPKYIEDK